ncbi:MAG: hypothetical protein JWN48_4200 [Myxococcaceae bacterium]|nr:hypothetical protein [Myxococcaceae bacterium]
MKVPAALATQPEWPLGGYSENSFREPDITLAGRTAHKLERTRRPGNSTHPTALAQVPRVYRFELVAADTALQAECTEVIAPKKMWLLRFGDGAVQLDCTCREGEHARASLALVDGKGTLALGGGEKFAVTPLYETVEGKTKKRALGYALEGASGRGALQRSGHGRAWAPSQLDERAATDLSCAYAALLLYRPEP